LRPSSRRIQDRSHLLKQYKDPLDSLTEDRKKKKIVYIFFSANIVTTNIFVATSTPKTIFKVSQTEGEKENLIGKFSFLQSEERKKRREIVNSQLGVYHQKNGSAWKSTSEEECFPQQLLLQRDPTTTEKLQNGLVNEEVCKIAAMHK
jgi:hypothetical protein